MMRFLRFLRRSFFWAALFFLLLITGLGLAEFDLEGSATLLIGYTFTGTAAVLLFGILRWWRPERDRRLLRRGLIALAGAAGGLVGLVTVVDAYEYYPVITAIAAQASFFLPAASWYYLANGEWSSIKKNQDWRIIWKVLAIGATLVLFTLVAYQYEPVAELFGTAYLLVFSVLGIRWLIRQIQAILRLRKEKKMAELQHLKSQVSPHFFFNMLNNLYGIVDRDGEKAKQLILKLSDLMRYGIYEGQKHQVPLTGEVDHLRNFVALHQMRYHKKVAVDFELNLGEREWSVMPLLFIILVENAFKHGVENLRHNAYVKIALRTSDEAIHFSVTNNFDLEALSDLPGIGLANLERRLALAYPDRHEYSFTATADIYTAELTLREL